eukprot:m51a1_g9051 hypothetical protein (185) ;mRNA; f:32048-32789
MIRDSAIGSADDIGPAIPNSVSARSWSTTAGHSSVKLTNYGRVVALTLALELLQLALVPLDLILESTSSGPGTAQHSVARGVRAAWSFGSNTGAGAAWASGAVTLVAWVVPFGWAMHAASVGSATGDVAAARVVAVGSLALRLLVMPATATAACMHTRGGVANHIAAVFAEAIVVPIAFYCALL